MQNKKLRKNTCAKKKGDTIKFFLTLEIPTSKDSLASYFIGFLGRDTLGLGDLSISTNVGVNLMGNVAKVGNYYQSVPRFLHGFFLRGPRPRFSLGCHVSPPRNTPPKIEDGT